MLKSSWIGIGFSHHRVPSLSNVATRCSSGIEPGPLAELAASTNCVIAWRVGVSFQDGSGSPDAIVSVAGHGRSQMAFDVDVHVVADVEDDLDDPASAELELGPVLAAHRVTGVVPDGEPAVGEALQGRHVDPPP
jgi:hypothetical protein